MAKINKGKGLMDDGLFSLRVCLMPAAKEILDPQISELFLNSV